MTIAIVDFLEIVDIHNDHRNGFSTPATAVAQRLAKLIECAPGVQPGQVIDVRQLLRLAARYVQFARHQKILVQRYAQKPGSPDRRNEEQDRTDSHANKNTGSRKQEVSRCREQD